MFAFPATTTISHHVRSESVPSNHHPLLLKVNKQWCQLNATEAIPSTSSSICNKLSCLQNLYQYLDELLLLPLTQRALSLEQNRNWRLDEVLNGSLRLLEVCGTSRDILLQMKECAQDLHSFLRRSRGREFSQASEVNAYMSSTKRVNKVIKRCLADMKKMKNQFPFSSIQDNDHEVQSLFSLLRNVEAVTIPLFESLMLFLCGSKAMSSHTYWFLVSKLIHTKHVACEAQGTNISEVGMVNITLNALICHKRCVDVKDAQKLLEVLEMSIHCIEDGLECLFRCLIKNRVLLLNIFNR